MKLIRGIVREDFADAVVQALERAGASGATVTRIHGRGQTTRTGSYRGSPYAVLEAMCAIDIVASDEATDDIVRAVIDNAHTGHHGDGHVLVLTLEQSWAIRNRWPDVA
jgi:nitrogen regulatory protein P-II 1